MTAINSNRAIRGPVTAVPVVAGKGVRIVPDVENNRFVVEADETVLFYDSDGTATTTATLSEPPTNFERIGITCKPWTAETGYRYIEIPTSVTPYVFNSAYVPNTATIALFSTRLNYSSGALVCERHVYQNSNAMGTLTNGISYFKFIKVVGINRISST